MKNRLYFLVKDPHWTFLCWEIDPRQRISPAAGSRWILRIYDITDILFDGHNAHSFFDIEGIEHSDHWYLHLLLANRNYCAEIGWRSEPGLFQCLVRSNTLYLPPDGPADCPGEITWQTFRPPKE